MAKRRRYLSNGGRTDNNLYPVYFPNGEVFGTGTDTNVAELLNMPPYNPLQYERIYYPNNTRNAQAIDIELSKLPQNATFNDRLNVFRNLIQNRNNSFRNNNYNTIDLKKRRK